jgi:hypothetical protein
VEPSRFWLRRNNDDRARQVIYDEVQLDRYSDRQRRAILKAMSRGKRVSHSDIRRAAQRAALRPRGETPVAIALLLSAIVVLIISLFAWYRTSTDLAALESRAALRTAAARPEQSPPSEVTTAMDKADKAWLSDVGAGKVATTVDGADALSLPQSDVPAPAEAVANRGHNSLRSRHKQP